VLVVKTDISKEEEVKNLFAEVQKTFGRGVDVLLNNASILGEREKRFAEEPVGMWWETVVSFFSFFFALLGRRDEENMGWSGK
jgi:NAD(P)-dependent dehydrogenase (short-subunit alcohol dehydrogenase family)